MKLSSHVAILIILIYSFFLSFYTSLHVSELLPIFLELYRNKLDLFNILKKLLLINIFIFIIFITIYFSNHHLAFLILFRSNMILLFTLLLFNKKSHFHISLALYKLKIPDIFVSLFYFTSKFIYLMQKELSIFKKTLHVRGFEPKASMFSYKIYANFVGMLFVNAFYKAKTLSHVLTIRGYNGKIYSLQENQKLNIYEIILFVVVIVCLILNIGKFI